LPAAQSASFEHVAKQAPAPLQVYAPQVALGSVSTGMLVQVPAGVRLQALHAPQEEVEQHEPSTQLLLEHSLPAPQVWPSAFIGTHAPAPQ
jgi:hypothetical protein